MILKVATTFKEIMEGWRLVYFQYLKSALIKMNPFSIFTYPEYVSRNSAVILGRVDGKSICSVSAVLDSKNGLPLDACFPEELDRLRGENKKLIEIGLLANLAEKASPFYLIALLSSIARFGVYSNFHDYVIGVHPRRAKFFKELFGFHEVGTPRPYHKLREAEVILLHADGQMFETMSQKANLAVYFEEAHLKFEDRYRFLRLASLKPFILASRAVAFLKKIHSRIWKRNFNADLELKTVFVENSK